MNKKKSVGVVYIITPIIQKPHATLINWILDIANVTKKIVDEQEWCEWWRDGMLSKHIRKRALSEQFTEVIHKLNVIEQELKGDINVNEI